MDHLGIAFHILNRGQKNKRKLDARLDSITVCSCFHIALLLLLQVFSRWRMLGPTPMVLSSSFAQPKQIGKRSRYMNMVFLAGYSLSLYKFPRLYVVLSTRERNETACFWKCRLETSYNLVNKSNCTAYGSFHSVGKGTGLFH